MEEKKSAKQRKLIAVVEPPAADATDEELDAFADALFEKIQNALKK